MAFISSHTIQLFAATVGMAPIPCTLSQSRLCVHIQYSSTVSHDDGGVAMLLSLQKPGITILSYAGHTQGGKELMVTYSLQRESYHEDRKSFTSSCTIRPHVHSSINIQLSVGIKRRIDIDLLIF